MVAIRIQVGTNPERLPAEAGGDQARALPAPVLVLPGRRDALPEHTHYADTGCDLHPTCLTCPRERCRYDEPGGGRQLRSELRDRAIVLLQRRGRPVGEIARRFGVSRRTVFRVLARHRRRLQAGDVTAVPAQPLPRL